MPRTVQLLRHQLQLLIRLKDLKARQEIEG